jgi:hypothetical protein
VSSIMAARKIAARVPKRRAASCKGSGPFSCALREATEKGPDPFSG